MIIEKLKNEIVVKELDDFDIDHILLCGQIFRYKKTDFGYLVFSKDKVAKVYKGEDSCRIVTDDVDYFYNYFDLDTDYTEIKKTLSDFVELKKPLDYGSGIRILRQDIFETIISFIISANNNIKRIQGIVERISEGFGKKIGDFCAFPTIDELSLADENFYKSIGAGYRSPYLVRVVQQLKSKEFDIEKLKLLSTKELKKKLMELSGVGPKVADCILLFGFSRGDVFPVDTWGQKIYEQDFCGKETDRNKITDFFVDKFGNLSGYAQQYLFFYKREN